MNIKRPRSWKPNTLVLTSWINKKISEGLAELMALRCRQGLLPEKFRKYIPKDYTPEMDMKDVVKYVAKTMPPIRSCVEAPKGWCLIESDYQTAELRGLAFLSACDAMMDLITKPDPNFAKVKPELMEDEDCVVRVGYPEFIPECNRDPKWLMTYGVDDQVVRTYTEDDLLRDESGNIVHAKQDLHWSLAEMVKRVPRESLLKKRDRNAAKIAGFSSIYGATGPTLERKIEADTGIKPNPGDGDALLLALEERQPRATAWLKSLEQVPVDPGFMQALSGRMRHFYTHPDNISGLSSRTRDGQISAMGREARNFP